MKKIILAGNGHGALSAYLSLIEQFDEVVIKSEDPSLIEKIRRKDKIISDFMETDVALCVCAGYQKLIPPNILKNKTFINTHPSLLPKYRGMHSVVWAMLNNEKRIGFTVHLMNEWMDDGAIINQFSIENTGQSSKYFMDEFDRYVQDNLGQILVDFMSGKIIPVPQNRDCATWVPRRNLEDCIIDFRLPNWQLRALFNALVSPYPLPRIKINGIHYEVSKYQIIDIDYYSTVGRVVNIENNIAYIKTAEGLLLIEELFDVEGNQFTSPSMILKLGQRL
jgi:methionyl-tRNA formyltransferase